MPISKSIFKNLNVMLVLVVMVIVVVALVAFNREDSCVLNPGDSLCVLIEDDEVESGEEYAGMPNIMVEDMSEIVDIYINKFPDQVAAFAASDIARYLTKDKLVQVMQEDGDLREIIRGRYDLNTIRGRDLALTDLYEIVRRSSTLYYEKMWPCSLDYAYEAAEIICENGDDVADVGLLKSRIAFMKENYEDAFNEYSIACRAMATERRNDSLVSMVDIAKAMLDSTQISNEKKEEILSLAYVAGLKENSDFSNYLKGEKVDTILTYLRSSIEENPTDISDAKKYISSIGEYTSELLESDAAHSVNKDISIGSYAEVSMQLAALIAKRDSRALIEFSNSKLLPVV